MYKVVFRFFLLGFEIIGVGFVVYVGIDVLKFVCVEFVGNWVII